MIVTERLILRAWREEDLAPFHAMGQDAEVMRYLGPRASWEDCRRAIERMTVAQVEHGYCFWAIESRDDAAFLGFCGLLPAKPPITGEIEIGWRLARMSWGKGLALEAARASLDLAWTHLDIPSVAAITVPANHRSRALMERLGMTRVDGGDFDHPDLAPDSPLRRHVLYRIDRPAE